MHKIHARLSRLITGLALSFLLFVAGGAAIYFEWPGTQFLINAFEGGKFWIQTQENQRALSGLKKIGPTEPLHTVIRWDPKRAYNGYTLISYAFSTTVYLMDMEGNVVYKWNMPFNKVWSNPTQVHARVKRSVYIETAYAYPNGDLLIQYEGLGDTPYGFGIAKIDKHSNLLWSFNQNAHHDFYVDPDDGTIYALTHSIVRNPPQGLENFYYPLLTDSIAILSSQGKELDRIPIMQAFLGTPYESYLFSRPLTIPNSFRWDALHTNSIAKVGPEVAAHSIFKENQLLVSIRNIGALAVIDPQSKKVVWAYRGFWNFIHAARFTPEGNILVFDDEGYLLQKHIVSHVFEFNPTTNEVKWHFEGLPAEPMHSLLHDRIQRLANGNTLIAVGSDKNVLEVTQDNKIVWELEMQLGRSGWLGSVRRYAAADLPFVTGH